MKKKTNYAEAYLMCSDNVEFSFLICVSCMTICFVFGIKEDNVIGTNPFILLATCFVYYSVHIIK